MKLKLLGHEYISRVEHFTDLYQDIVSRYNNSVDDHKIDNYFNPIISKSSNLRKIRIWPENFADRPKITIRKQEVSIPVIEMTPCPHLDSGFSFYYETSYSFTGGYSKWDKKLFDSRIPEEIMESTGVSSLHEAYELLMNDGLLKLLEAGVKSIDETIDRLIAQSENLKKFKEEDSVMVKVRQLIKERKLS